MLYAKDCAPRYSTGLVTLVTSIRVRNVMSIMTRQVLSSIAKSSLGAAVALGVLAAGQAQALTLNFANSFSFGGSSYHTLSVDEGISWALARTFAQSLGGGYDLVSINSEAENTAVFDQITDPSLWVGNGVGPYIGLFQPSGSAEPGGDWQWVDGTPITSFINWYPGQPDDFSGDNIGIFYGGGLIGSTWGDNIGDGTFSPSTSFVVEAKDATSVPGPLPIFGAAAAFGFSRQLRKRIKGSSSTVPNTYTL